MGIYGSEDRDEVLSKMYGKTVSAVYCDGATLCLTFGDPSDPDPDYVAFEVDGGCCSSSWFSDLIGVEALIGGTVTNFSELGFPEGWKDPYEGAEERGEYECLSTYGYQFITDKGRCDVVFRNSSNGYYGGWMEMLNLTEKPDVIQEQYNITQDWSN